ncbi:MAG: TetR family transcriptional regulator [Alphaproteobacteria bacterium]|nr:TetR family transcriptional regulator [Alphaproteobacteria bacterium]
MSASQGHRKRDESAFLQGVTENPLDAENPKRAAILEASAQLFLENGYETVSMDAIAATANVSKRTVYSNFESKEELFTAIMVAHCNAMVGEAIPSEESDGAPAQVLTAYGRAFVAMITSPRALAMQRVIFSEVARNPELGRRFYEAGPARHLGALARYLDGAVRRGEFEIRDTRAAAAMFIAHAKGPFHLPQLCGLLNNVSKKDIDEAVDNAVQVFLRAYRPAPRPKRGSILL